MKSFAFPDLGPEADEMPDTALAGPVLLTDQGWPKLVVLPYEGYEWISYPRPRAYTLENASEHTHAELMSGLDRTVAKDAAE